MSSVPGTVDISERSCPTLAPPGPKPPTELRQEVYREVLHRGTFCKVYLYQHRQEPTSCSVLKFFKASAWSKKEKEKILKLEAYFQSQFEHEHILPCIDIFKDEKEYFAIMYPFLPGGDLGALIPEEGMSQTEAGKLFLQLAKGVAFIHRAGFAHRNIQPANLLLSGGTLKIADFGACVYAAMPGGRMNPAITPYSSPEQVSGEEKQSGFTPSDVWAMGVVLFELLTGVVPWGLASPKNANYGSFVDQPRERDAVWNKIEASTADFINEMLVVPPEERLSSRGICHHPWITDNGLTRFTTEERIALANKELAEKTLDGPAMGSGTPKLQFKSKCSLLQFDEGESPNMIRKSISQASVTGGSTEGDDQSLTDSGIESPAWSTPILEVASPSPSPRTSLLNRIFKKRHSTKL